MDITHYYEFNEQTGLYELRKNDDTLVACFAEYDDMKVFMQASPDVHTVTSVNC